MMTQSDIKTALRRDYCLTCACLHSCAVSGNDQAPQPACYQPRGAWQGDDQDKETIG